MQIGQLYKIRYTTFYTSADTGVTEERIAKLIFEGKYFYVFEYRSRAGDMLRVSLHKNDRDYSIKEV